MRCVRLAVVATFALLLGLVGTCYQAAHAASTSATKFTAVSIPDPIVDRGIPAVPKRALARGFQPATTTTMPWAPIIGSPYEYGSWFSRVTCQNGHSTNYAKGPKQASIADAIANYISDVDACFGVSCSYTVQSSDPSLSSPYIVAYVQLTSNCTGNEDIYASAQPTNLGNQDRDSTPYVGDPLNASTGNKALVEDDFVGNPWLAFRRYYNSDASTTTASIGMQWRHSFDRTMNVMGTPVANILVTRPDGSTDQFTKASGQWVGQTSSVDVLSEQDDTNGNVLRYTLFLGHTRQTEIYSPAGLLQSVSDSTGQGIALTYSTATTPTSIAPSAGLLITVTDSKGRQLNLTYNGSGRVATVILPDQGVLSYAYNGLNYLSSVTYPDTSVRQYLYDETSYTAGAALQFPALTGIIDENNVRYSSTTYNASGLATGSYFAANAYSTSVTYNSDGTSSITYPLGHSATMSYDQINGENEIASVDQPCGRDCKQSWKARTYDNNGYPSSYTDFNGATTTTQYDVYGDFTQKVDAVGTSSQRTTLTTWDTNLRLPLTRMVQDENGNTVAKTGWAYSATGQPLAICKIDPALAPSYSCSASGTAPNGVRRWTYTYCTAVGTGCPLVGLLQTVTGPRTDVAQQTTFAYYTVSSNTSCGTPGAACYQSGDLHTITDAKGHVTTFVSYDADGRVTRSTDANGINTDTTYTPRGWIATRSVGGATTTLTYWPYGAVKTTQDPDGVLTSYTYDSAHRLVRITDDLNNYTVFTLDAAGNKTAEQTFTSSGTLVRGLARSFNSLGRITAIVDGLGRTILDASGANSYDANGNLVLSSDANGIQRAQGADPLNRLVSMVDNYNGTDTATQNTSETLAYDALDRLVGVSDPSGLNTIYGYDALGNRTSLSSPDSGNVADTYDSAGNRKTHTDAKGTTSTFTYDALNRVLSTSFSDSSQNVAYSYDEANSATGCASSTPQGHLTRIIETNVTTIYCYDGKGNVLQKSQVIGTQTDTTTYTYTVANRLKSVTYPDGTLVAYTYNGNGRAATVKVTPDGASAAQNAATAITWLPFGPLSGYTLGNGQTISRTFDGNYRVTDVTSPLLTLHLAYDPMGRLTAMGNAAGANPATENYSYDPLYRLTGVSDTGVSIESYTYNRAGDRLSKTSAGLATGAYSYAPGTHLLVATGNSSRTNDPNGSTLGMVVGGSTFGFGYDLRGRVSTVVANGSAVANYTYNALGQRIQKTATFPSSFTERYDYDQGGRLIAENGGTTRDYVWLENTPVAIVDVTINGSVATSVVNFVHADGLDTPRIVANAAGAAIWTWAFKGNPFGEQAPSSSVGYVLNLRFSGQYYDAESGTSYNLFRNYDPTVGRYLQADPNGLAGGVSTFGYAGSSPLLYTDPDGRCPMCIGAIIGGVAGAIGGYETGGWEGAIIGGTVGAIVGAVAPGAATAIGDAAVNFLVSTGATSAATAAIVGDTTTVAAFAGINAGGSAVGTVITNYEEGQPVLKDVGQSAAIGAAGSLAEGIFIATAEGEAGEEVASAFMSFFTGLTTDALITASIPIQPTSSPGTLPTVPTITALKDKE